MDIFSWIFGERTGEKERDRQKQNVGRDEGGEDIRPRKWLGLFVAATIFLESLIQYFPLLFIQELSRQGRGRNDKECH